MNPVISMRALSFAALAVVLFSSAAIGQEGWNYHVKTMNFDLWCQEQAHLPADRCDKRLPEDEKVFEAYRAKIERYEIPYLKERREDLSINRDILHNDQVDNPMTQNPQAQTQDPDRQPPAPLP